MNQTIRKRRTLKVLADPSTPWPPPGGDFDGLLLELLDLAACAPFHYPCDPSHQLQQLDAPAPWRCYALNGANARELLKRISTLDAPPGKIAGMLAAAHGLVLVTWLPDPPPSGVSGGFQSFEPTLRNMEHIAATAAAIQNLLLAATDSGLHTFWSSGGVLRSQPVFDWLGIPDTQVLLGAVFLFPQDTHTADTKPGANRNQQGERDRWMKWIGFESLP